MWIANEIDDLRRRRRAIKGKVALVPTMGALHRGHLSLITAARGMADEVIVSIFVNPTQFGPGEDFKQYPRDTAADVKKCLEAGAAGVFSPSVETMYPPRVPESSLTVPSLADDLEGEQRPGHFDGVGRVVLKLLNLCEPDVACFGQKDYQQLVLVHSIVSDLNLDVTIAGCPTMREADGLAMSSRNVYLDEANRKRAVGLSVALLEAAKMAEDGETDPGAIESAMRGVMVSHQIEVDYAAVRHARTLASIDCVDPGLGGGVVALVAGRLPRGAEWGGEVRLLDNRLLGEA